MAKGKWRMENLSLKRKMLWGISLLVGLMLVVLCIPVCAGATESGATETVSAGDDSATTEEETKQEELTLQFSAATATSVTLKWNRIKGVSKYEILRSTKKKSGYKKIATVKAGKTKYKSTKLSEKKTYYYKVRAVLSDKGTITSNRKTKVKVRGSYSKGSVYGPSLSTAQLNTIKNKVANFVNVYTEPEMDDFIKVLYAHNYICNICSYETGGWNVNYANTALGTLKYGRAQCSGYARAFKALCDGMGVGCRYVHANSKAANPSHQWNLVKVDKKWYIIDVQCNDNSGFYATFLIGKKSKNSTYSPLYEYNTKGLPALSKKDYDYSKYYDYFN
jgi:transglutaminase/protease-like cytokinesis protein 3